MKPTSSTRTCGDCRFAVMEEYGYSNWTVEGTYFHCAKGLHPEDGFDRWYGEDKRLEFAEKCDGFEEGNPVELDVDRECLDDLTGEQKAVLAMWEEK